MAHSGEEDPAISNNHTKVNSVFKKDGDNGEAQKKEEEGVNKRI